VVAVGDAVCCVIPKIGIKQVISRKRGNDLGQAGSFKLGETGLPSHCHVIQQGSRSSTSRAGQK
jgi:hypothetical protein